MKKLFALLFSTFVILIVQVGYAGPLHNAVVAGDIKKVTALLDSGTDVNVRHGGSYSTALHYAVTDNNIEMVRLLLERGADINAPGTVGRTPMGIAASNGHIEIMDLLIDKGADVNKAITGLAEEAQWAGEGWPTFPWIVTNCQNGIKLLQQKGNPNMIGWVKYSKGNYQEAIKAFNQAVSLNPLESNNFIGLSASHNALQQYEEAITAARRAIELKPSSARAYNELGVAYFHKKEFKDAITASQKAIEIEPNNASLHDNLGGLFYAREEYGRALENYKKVTELTPDDPKSLLMLAGTYLAIGKYDDALVPANRAVELQTYAGTTGLILSAGSSYPYPVVKDMMETGPAKKAGIEIGDKIVRVDGKSTKGWKMGQIVQNILRGTTGDKVVLTIERKDVKPFEKIIARETVMDKNAAESFGLRSLVHRHKENQEDAFRDAEKSYSLNPASNIARLSLGASYLDRGNNGEAIKILAQIKDSPMAQILEATAYAKAGKMEEAVNTYLAIPEGQNSPNHIPLTNDRAALLETFKPFTKERVNKARSFEANGQYKKALSGFAEALKTADEAETEVIQEAMFSIVRKNPPLSEIPDEARRHMLRGEVLVKEGSFKEAAAELKKAIQIAPYIGQLYYNSAFIDDKLEKYPEAIRNMKIYLKSAPDAPNARETNDQIFKWEFAIERGKT